MVSVRMKRVDGRNKVYSIIDKTRVTLLIIICYNA